MKHHSPHARDDHPSDDPEPGQLPVDPDDGLAPIGLPDDPEQEGIVDPKA